MSKIQKQKTAVIVMLLSVAGLIPAAILNEGGLFLTLLTIAWCAERYITYTRKAKK